MSDTQSFELSLEQQGEYEFRVRFEDSPVADLVTDESAPLGHDAGPNPSRLLATSVGNCLAASLLFALRKFKNQPGPVRARVRTTLARNEQRRWRIQNVAVTLELTDAAGTMEHLERALEQFEEFCIVTQSVREGVEVDVSVVDGEGRKLH